MIFDLQNGVTALSQGTYDVCVCGTGPAGITVARELASSGLKVALLEAGGMEFSQRSQDVYLGTESGLSTYKTALISCRLRYFGGTSNHWTGLCGALQESDFWDKRYHALPGWPIPRASVQAFAKEASAILDISTTDFSPTRFGNPRRSWLDRPTLVKSPPTRFGAKYRDEISRSQNITLFVNANVVDIQLTEGAQGGARVGHVVVKNYRKEGAIVSARNFVLALGSIENARILLNANKQLPAGVGNHSDFVGRCFMEHFNIEIGRFVARDSALARELNGSLQLTEQASRRLNIGNGFLALHANVEPEEAGRLAGVRSMLRTGVCANDTVRDFARWFQDFECAGDGVINSLIEQAPNPESRVTLGTQTDEFGLKRAHLHWMLSDMDRRTIRTIALETAKGLVDLDVARVQLNKAMVDLTKEISVWNHAHQMGTTRMSADPRYGVVDPHCRVHGVSNLHIASSSVFPTGGGVNPTYTIVMLALRLARHLSNPG